MRAFGRRLMTVVHKAEPWSLLATYFTIVWCAYVAWFHPPDSAKDVLTVSDQMVQATLFTLGGFSALWGHFSGRLFIEELGIIFSTIATSLYFYAVVSYTLRNDSFWTLSLILGLVLAVIFLLINRIMRIQAILSSKWLKPSVQHLYEDGKE